LIKEERNFGTCVVFGCDERQKKEEGRKIMGGF
jgi:hypothetical protein